MFQFIVPLLLILVSSGCSKISYSPKPIDVNDGYQVLQQRSLNDHAVQDYLAELGLQNKSVSDLDYLTGVMLYFNPDIEVLVRKSKSAILDKEIAASSRSVNIQIPFGYNTVTNDNRSPWLFGFVVDLFYERRPKREARMLSAEAGYEIARLNILKKAWDLKQQLHKAYWQVYLNNRQIELINQEIEIKKEIIELLEVRKDFGEANTFEISSARLNLQSEVFEKTRFQLNKTEAFYTLLKLLGVIESDIKLDDVPSLLTSELNKDTNITRETLQNIALHKRTDLLLALLQYKIAEADLSLAIEKQYPDITLSPGFIFDQSDNIWALGASWVLPLMSNERPKIEKSLRERELQQSKVLQTQAAILNELGRLYSIQQHQKQALQSIQKIIAEFEIRHEISKREYEFGTLDRLEYLRSELEKINLQQTQLDMQVNSILLSGRIERAVEYVLNQQFELGEAISILLKHEELD